MDGANENSLIAQQYKRLFNQVCGGEGESDEEEEEESANGRPGHARGRQ